MLDVYITKSHKPEKKFDAVFINPNTGKVKRVAFGQKGYEHYTEGHLDEKRKQNYIQRHRAREDWNDLFTAGYWSYHFLW